MSANGSKFDLKDAAPKGIFGVLLEVRTDQKLHIVPSDSLSVKNPQELKTVIDLLASGIAIMAERRIMDLEGEGREVLKDALVAYANGIKALVAKHMPRMEGKLIDLVPLGTVHKLQG